MSEKPKNVYQRCLAVMGQVTKVYKDQSVVTNKRGDTYAAVSHDQVASKVRVALIDNGVFVQTSVSHSENGSFTVSTQYGDKEQYRTDLIAELTFINVDEPSDRFTVSFPGYSFDSQDKSVGKALSYAVKNGLLKNFLLPSGDKEEERVNQGASQQTIKKGDGESIPKAKPFQLTKIRDLMQSKSVEVTTDIKNKLENINTIEANAWIAKLEKK